MKTRGIGLQRVALAPVLLAMLASVPRSAGGETSVGDPFVRCQEMVEAAPDDYRSYACFWAEARSNDLLDRAATLLRALLEEDPDNPHRSGYLAAVEMDRGEVDTAAALYRQSADGHARLGNATAEAHVRLTFSYLLAVQMGRLDEAEAEIVRVRSLMDSVSDPSLPGWLAMRETSLANKRLEFGRALQILRRVEPDFFPDGPWVLQQLWLNYMGFTMRALGRLDAAFRAYQSEAELLEAHGASFEEAIPRRNMTLLAIRRGQPTAACRQLAREALEAAIRGGNRRMEAQVHRDLSVLTSGSERLLHAERALAIARDTQYPLAIMEGLRALALALAETDPGKALTLVQESIDLADEQRDLSQMAYGHLAYAEIVRRTAPLDVALQASLRALDITESTRLLQPDPEIRARHFGIWTDPYYILADYLLHVTETDATAAAFSVMERMRARTLLDELAAARATDPVPPSIPILEEHQALLHEIAAVQRRLLRPDLSELDRAQATHRLQRLETDEVRLREDLRRVDPSFAVLDRTEHSSLTELQEALAEDQAMLLFQVPGPGLDIANRPWLLSVTRTGVRTYELPAASWIEAAVPLFSGLLEAGGAMADDGAARIYDRLLSNAIEQMDPGIRKLVIVPDRSLHLLPFGALRASGGDDPLGVRFDLTIAPSATVWIYLRNRAPNARGSGALVLADPILSMGSSSPERSGEPSLSPDHQDLGSLPYSRTEARSVGRRLGRRSRLLMGADASETAFKRAPFGDFAVVHLAAHAIVDPQEPQRSGLLLTPGAESEDGLLQIQELKRLDLEGQLVVLSACRTGGGLIVAGEGPMSLARPLFLAGASAVVASLWPLPDRAAAELFDRFYSHLARGLSVAGALSEARHDMVRRGAPARAWAGIVVLGNGDQVPYPHGQRRPPRLVWLLAVIVATLSAGLLLQRRRARRQG